MPPQPVASLKTAECGLMGALAALTVTPQILSSSQDNGISRTKSSIEFVTKKALPGLGF